MVDSQLAVVLAVDDEGDILQTLKEYLEGALPAVRVLTAASGAAGLAMLRKEPVDLILTDYRMPKMNGLQFLDEAAKLAPDVPRIMVTAFPDMSLAIKALNEAKVLHFLTKPVEPEAVRDIVGATLAAQRAIQHRNAAFQRSLDVMRQRARGQA